MCTAIWLDGAHPVLGRTLDYEFTYGEQPVLTPRHFPLRKIGAPKTIGENTRHYAVLGMAHVVDGIPLYYDALNEHGLAIAGLNFVGNASYFSPTGAVDDCPVHALIPTLLSAAKCVDEALALLAKMRIVASAPRRDYPIAELHFILADRTRCIVIEQMANGMQLYENPTGVLTNNPPLPIQLAALAPYETLSPYEPQPRDRLAKPHGATCDFHTAQCAPTIFPCADQEATSGTAYRQLSYAMPFSTYTKGRGAFGLPGDYTSSSRFVRAAFGRRFASASHSEEEAVERLFSLLDTVMIPDGSVRGKEGCDLTQYASAMTLNSPSYTYRTRTNRRLCRVCLSDFMLDGERLIPFPLRTSEDVLYER